MLRPPRHAGHAERRAGATNIRMAAVAAVAAPRTRHATAPAAATPPVVVVYQRLLLSHHSGQLIQQLPLLPQQPPPRAINLIPPPRSLLVPKEGNIRRPILGHFLDRHRSLELVELLRMLRRKGEWVGLLLLLPKG